MLPCEVAGSQAVKRYSVMDLGQGSPVLSLQFVCLLVVFVVIWLCG